MLIVLQDEDDDAAEICQYSAALQTRNAPFDIDLKYTLSAIARKNLAL